MPVTERDTQYYTSGEAVEVLNINPILFRWIVRTENVKPPRLGNRAVYTEETLQEVRAILDRKDPNGKFRVRAERRNGPRGNRAAKPEKDKDKGKGRDKATRPAPANQSTNKA
jgi:hypothetical protein